MGVLGSLRQLAFPREFRIQATTRSVDILKHAGLIHEFLSAAERQMPPAVEGTDDGLSRMLADIATGLWRMRRRMLDSETGQPREEMRRVYRQMEATWDALSQAGVEIVDHTDKPYDGGLLLKAIAFQPTSGIERDVIIETIRPSIYFKDQRVQIGEVVIGTPQITPGSAVSPEGPGRSEGEEHDVQNDY
jgi:hypothetical protein